MDSNRLSKIKKTKSMLSLASLKKDIMGMKVMSDEILILYKEFVMNQNVDFDRSVLTPDSEKPKLNIYAFDGTNSNRDIRKRIESDDNKKVVITDDTKDIVEVIKSISRKKFDTEVEDFSEFFKKTLAKMEYSEIHLICYKYESIGNKTLEDVKLFPIDISFEFYDGPDYLEKSAPVEILWDLVSFYIIYKVKEGLYMSKLCENAHIIG